MNRGHSTNCETRSARSPAWSGRRFAVTVWVACFVFPAVGCHSLHGNTGPQRLEHGYTLILPGILGEQGWDHNVVDALEASPYPGAVVIHDWTHGPLLFGWNMFSGHRAVEKISAQIMTYQDLYPGRPVHMIGHSGGCKIVVKTLEALPPGSRIDKAVLLAPCLSSDYDLRQAMSHTRSGICAYSSPLDVPISVPLTGLRGLADGELRLPAATVGFKIPSGLSTMETRRYEQLLDQRHYSWDMLENGHPGGHFGWTTRSFVTGHIVPQIVPPGSEKLVRGTNSRAQLSSK